MDLQIARKHRMHASFIHFILYSKTHAATLVLAQIGAFWCAYRALKREPRLRFLAIICSTSLVFFYMGEESTYFVYWIPFCMIAVAAMTDKAKCRRLVVSLFVLAAITELTSRGINFARHDGQSYAAYSRVLYRSIPVGSSIVAMQSGWGVLPYFAVRGRNPLIIIPPLPVDPEKVENVVERADYVVSEFPLPAGSALVSRRTLVAECLQGPYSDLYVYGPARTPN
jgi:hypothetical protein